MKKISILGCGWLGKPLGRRLVEDGFMVSGSTTREENLQEIRSLGIQPFHLNLSPVVNGSGYQNFFEADVLIVSIPPRRRAGNAEAYPLQLVEAKRLAMESGIKNIIFISSTSVYNDINRIVSEEDADPAGFMKNAEDIFLNEPSFKTTVIRFSGLIGPGRHPGRFFSGKETTGGDTPVNMIHIDDCIGIIQKVIETNAYGNVFNACADSHPSKETFYAWAAMDAGLPLPIFSKGEKHDFKIVSSDKLKKILEYKFIYPDPLKMKFV